MLIWKEQPAKFHLLPDYIKKMEARGSIGKKKKTVKC